VNLHALLLEREAAGRPVTVGLIGAGKFGTMFLSQARLTRGMRVLAVADLNVGRARAQLDAYFSGKRRDFDLPLKGAGTVRGLKGAS